MSWRGYAEGLRAQQPGTGDPGLGLFMTQAWLPLNPDAIPNMRWDTALHTMVSFLTNTNQQHYSGQAQLSYLSQMVGIVGLQVITPDDGAGAAVGHPARPVRRPPGRSRRSQGHGAGAADVGNYWADVIATDPALHAAALPAVERAADLAGRARRPSRQVRSPTPLDGFGG
jgi:K+-transporting ATPase ATPase A chain